MSLSTTELEANWDRLSQWLTERWSQWRKIWQAPPPDPAVFLKRVHFIERNVGLPVKAAIMPLLAYYLFFGIPMDDVVLLQQVALSLLRNFFFLYSAASIGAGIFFWGMNEVPPRVVERAVYVMALLDAALLALLTLYTGGFDSSLYWIFLGLIVRNAAVIAHSEVQILVNLLVTGCYVCAGVLDINFAQTDVEVTSSIGRGSIDLTVSGPGEQLALRIILLVVTTAWCVGIQKLVDRQRRAEVEEQEFAFKQQQLEAAGRLAAEIAHQLKNPLGIINNAAYTLQKTVKEGKTITQQISIIREEVQRSDKILTELMGYAQLAEGRVERIHIPDELDAAVRNALPPGANFEIKVHHDYALGLPQILGQRGHFSEVFLNLITNAREAMNGRGDLFLKISHGPDPSIIVQIRDTGPGIPPEHLGKIFEPYFTSKEKGTGLGLAIVRHNVELYGGTVSVESTLGNGAHFTITLPARALMRIRR
jgi:signal transduction histidine kinase